MQTNKTQTRDDIEIAIESCKEEIYEYHHAVRWFIRFVRFFWSGVIATIIVFAILYPLNIPIIQSLLTTIGIASIILAIVAGIFSMVISLDGDFALREPFGSNLRNLRKAKQNLAKLYRKLAHWDEQALRYLTAEQYMHQLPELIASYRKRADQYRKWFVTTQLITILLSTGITSLSGGWLDRYFSIPWIIPVIGALISILTSFTLFFKFREKGTNLQQTADSMDWEHMACTLGIDRYKGLSKDAAQVLLAEQAEALRKEQQKKQLQLEQSSHAEQKALQSST
ncbi:MAG: DUF4231 domain-containing protein [Ktedonobacteraceae bacterium]